MSYQTSHSNERKEMCFIGWANDIIREQNAVPARHKLRLIKPFGSETLNVTPNVPVTYSLKCCNCLLLFFHGTKFLRYCQASLGSLGRIMELKIQTAPETIHNEKKKHSNSCNFLDPKFLMNGVKKPVPTAETKCVFMSNCNWLILFRKIILFH